jgi:hypothetical protein
MAGPGDFSPHDLQLRQGPAQQVTALRPELVNNDATVGELAWVWGKDHDDFGDTWRRRHSSQQNAQMIKPAGP